MDEPVGQAFQPDSSLRCQAGKPDLHRIGRENTMAANVYECMFLLDTNKVSGDVQNAAKQLQGILERNPAQVLASRPWDERRLAYPIGKHKKGLYYLAYF